MSDDEQEITYTRRSKTIHYGSLEEQDRHTLISDEPESSKAGTGDGFTNLADGEWGLNMFILLLLQLFCFFILLEL